MTCEKYEVFQHLKIFHKWAPNQYKIRNKNPNSSVIMAEIFIIRFPSLLARTWDQLQTMCHHCL